MAQRVLIIFLSLFLLFSPILHNVCLGEQSPSIKADSSSYSFEDNHPYQHHPPCHNKVFCPSNLHCCFFLIENISFHFLSLDFYPVTLQEISSYPLEIARSVYHPPQIGL